MNGENRAKFVEAMRSFRDWAMDVVASRESTEWVVPTNVNNKQRFAFSLDAYNYFVDHYKGKLKHYKKEEELAVQIGHHRKALYKGEGAVLMKKSRFFLLPNRL
ncbi:MAG: hypothetical protein KGH53_03485 [Candidatus Micrarchaeota archaeon]|nr:hypothetical protein [Candidatus Micrarchaeota archaeon]